MLHYVTPALDAKIHMPARHRKINALQCWSSLPAKMHCLGVLAGMLKCLLIIVIGYQEGSASGVRRQVRWCERVGKSVGRGHWAGNKRWCQGVWESQVQHTECTHYRLLSASRMSSPFPLHLYSYWVSRTTCCYSTLHLANPCFVYTRQHRPIMHMMTTSYKLTCGV